MSDNVTGSLLGTRMEAKTENEPPDCGEVKDIPVGDLKGGVENNESAIEALRSKLPELDNSFHIHEKIGEGTFGNVYLASLKGLNSNQRFAIKHLIPTTHPKRMRSELDCLNRIGGKDNVVSCHMTMRQADCVVFIMPYLQHQKFADYVLDMDVEETRTYMKNLFLALKRVHSFNIIHRDVKPSNFLYDRKNKEFLLVDFGLAQKVNENEENSSLKPPAPKQLVIKRKREDDDVENAEVPPMKRPALQTLTNEMLNQQPVRPVALRYPKELLFAQQPVRPVALRYPKEPLSAQQRKCQEAKRRPLTDNATNVIAHQQEFQSLLPQKVVSVNSGASFVRVQNSQVQPGSGLFPRPTAAPLRRKDSCECSGRPQVCHVCLTRKAQAAPRAGTPGFRPPEVLLKFPYQTTAVDMWAAGVILLCILSGCYPFFRSPDDITALSELITIFGSNAVKTIAKKLGRNVICNETRKPLNLRILCENLRRRKVDMVKNGRDKGDVAMAMCSECHHSRHPDLGCLCESQCRLDVASCFPHSAYDLLARLLELDPFTRIPADRALQHPFITGPGSRSF